MRFTYKRLICFSVLLLITQISYGQVDVPQPAQNGLLGGGSSLRFTSGSTNGSTTSIQEAWGLNLIGDFNHPVKVNNASLLIGYNSAGENLGNNNLLKRKCWYWDANDTSEVNSISINPIGWHPPEQYFIKYNQWNRRSW